MSRVILERFPENPYPTPMTYECWMELTHTLDSCLEARHAHWLRSFVSFDGNYSLCEFEVPYAQGVREACREAGVSFKQVWRAEVLTEAESEVLNQQETPILVEAIHEPPMTPKIWEFNMENAQLCFKEHGIHKMITWMSPDYRRSICCFQAANAEDVRTAFRQAGIPFQHLWRSYLIKRCEVEQ
jgi:hypothetical protein